MKTDPVGSRRATDENVSFRTGRQRGRLRWLVLLGSVSLIQCNIGPPIALGPGSGGTAGSGGFGAVGNASGGGPGAGGIGNTGGVTPGIGAGGIYDSCPPDALLLSFCSGDTICTGYPECGTICQDAPCPYGCESTVVDGRPHASCVPPPTGGGAGFGGEGGALN